MRQLIMFLLMATVLLGPPPLRGQTAAPPPGTPTLSAPAEPVAPGRRVGWGRVLLYLALPMAWGLLVEYGFETARRRRAKAATAGESKGDA